MITSLFVFKMAVQVAGHRYYLDFMGKGRHTTVNASGAESHTTFGTYF